MKLRTYLLAGAVLIASTVLTVQAQVPGVNSTLQAVFNLVYDNSTMKPTYSASRFVAGATGLNDVCTLTGSATKNIRVRRVVVSGLANAVVSEPIQINKYSTLPVGGAGGLMTGVPYDSTNSLSGSTSNAATAIADVWTTSPTPGTLVGALADIIYTYGNLTTGAGAVAYTFNFGQLGSPVVLRGAAQNIAVNLGNVSAAGAQLACTFEWTEE